jgi:outer membrane protein assembly factor BamB
MMVAGSPTVAGARVLVPCYRMQGRIDYHVACYQLETGELLWSTLVISGQRERNMFGRSVFEFSASPLVVDGDRVLAQTELGTLAALDLFSGRILWQTTYEQIELPKTRFPGAEAT